MINDEIKQRFIAWWNFKKTDRPMMRLISRKSVYDKGSVSDLQKYIKSDSDYHINPYYRTGLINNMIITHNFHAEAFPYVDINLGPGSMASYLCCEPEFSKDTVWYNKAENLNINNIGFNNSTIWWERHINAVKKAVELSSDNFYVAIPDIQENLDIVSAIFGPEELCLMMFDQPDTVKRIQNIVDSSFFKYYETMYDLVKDKKEDCSYTAFSIWGEGKTAKIQCDFSALISCDMFDEYILPSLKTQCGFLNNAMYHLDGKFAVRHLKSILSINKLKALQWTPGAGEEDGGSEKWYNIYDAVIEAVKALWIGISDGTPDEWIYKAKKIIRRYGSTGIYFLFDETDELNAKKILRELSI